MDALSLDWRRVRLLSLVALLVGIGIASEWRNAASSDVLWLLWVAQRTSQGAVLYRDVAEVNPPLIVWLLQPMIAAAKWFSLEPLVVFRATVLMLGGLVAAWSWRAARPGPVRHTVGLLVLLVVITMPVGFFGEREHLLLAVLLPYLILSGTRVGAPNCAQPCAALAGMLAGVGVALKPHYALVPLLVSTYVSRQIGRAPWRLPEMVAGSVLLTGYVFAVVVFSPSYFELLGQLGSAYWEWRRAPGLLWLVGQGGSVFAGAVLLIYIVHRRVVEPRELADVLALATSGALTAALLQGKGFAYHFYPAIALAICLAGIMTRPSLRLGRPWLHASARALAIAAFLLGAGVFTYEAIKRTLSTSADMVADVAFRRELAPLPHRGTLVALSPQGGRAFSLVADGSFDWGLRFPMMWVPVAVYQDALRRGNGVAYHRPAEMQGIERWFFDAVIDDLQRARPDLLLIYRPTASGENRFDCWQYFGQDERFVRLLAEYVPAPDAGGYRVYRRRAHGPA